MNRARRIFSRRRSRGGLVLGAVAATSLVSALTSSHGQTDRIDESTARATTFLLSKQDQKGAIRESEANETAMTALSIMALTAIGHQPSDQTPEGTAVRKALDFVLTKE